MPMQARGHLVVPADGVLGAGVAPGLRARLQHARGLGVVPEEHLQEDDGRGRRLPPDRPDDALGGAQDARDVRPRRVLQELVAVVHRHLHDEEVGPLRGDAVAHDERQRLAAGRAHGERLVLDLHAAAPQRLGEVHAVARLLQRDAAAQGADLAPAPPQGVRKGLEAARLEDQLGELALLLEALHAGRWPPRRGSLLLDLHAAGSQLHVLRRFDVAVGQERRRAAHSGVRAARCITQLADHGQARAA
mmetsp:Transcript_91987/g.297691  ORF Transcript_91987/g.297691 Transcript_91987/m.297691 type:complete len:247 (+) Transcript_91987:713-1453(+)